MNFKAKEAQETVEMSDPNMSIPAPTEPIEGNMTTEVTAIYIISFEKYILFIYICRERRLMKLFKFGAIPKCQSQLQ